MIKCAVQVWLHDDEIKHVLCTSRSPRRVEELQETKLPVRLISTTSERRLVQAHETAPLRMKGDIEDVSSELDDGD
ncbi:hypothetical protein TNCV_4043801 [Trichonephila clavipes]|nr:hypothetical protein TNCV_4043801 [Trichonephila clavipes]